MSYSAIHSAIETLGQAFEEFKNTNEERLSKLEKGIEDPLVNAKLSSLEATLNQTQSHLQKLETLSQRPVMGRESSGHSHIHKKAFLNYLLKGDDQELCLLERKALDASSPQTGAFLLPESLVTQIYSPDLGYAPMRSLATVVQSNHHQYEMILGDTSQKAIWGESEIPTQAGQGTATPTFNRLTIPIETLFYMPILSRTLLADSSIDSVESWLMEELHKGLARTENQSFFSGNGEKKPKGILTYQHGPEGGANMFQSIKTNKQGAFPDQNPENCLIDLLHLLKPEYLKNASWIMSRSALSAVRKMRTPDGHYLWQPPLSVDMKTQTLLGYPIVLCDDMPQLEADNANVPLMVGDMREAYVIADRDITVQRDEFTHKPNIQLLIMKRVGGKVRNFDAMKFLHCSANE